MLLRILTGICGVAIIYLGFMVKNDKTNKYSKSLRDKYTRESVEIYLQRSFYCQLLFGGGLIIQALFGSGIGYYAGLIVCLIGIILLFVFVSKLEKKKVPYKKG